MDGTTRIDPVSHREAIAASGSASGGEIAAVRLTPPAIVRSHAHDVDALSVALSEWSLTVTQLRRGTFDARTTCIALGSVRVYRVEVNQPIIARWLTPDTCLSIARPQQGTDALTIDGHPMKHGDAYVAGPGVAGEVITRGHVIAMAVSCQLDDLHAHADRLGGSPVQRFDHSRIRCPGPAWTNAFCEAVDWVLQAAERNEQVVSQQSFCTCLSDVLLSRVNLNHAVLAPAITTAHPRAPRRLAVARAREYIHANLAEPLRLSELCRYARTQPRSLEYGFRETLGVTPIAYVRTVRLHRVRRLLQSTAVQLRSISEIALDCGFWHLSQFAVDYKAFFNESPSTTYRRTLAQLPRKKPRRGPISLVVTPGGSGRVRHVRFDTAISAAQ